MTVATLLDVDPARDAFTVETVVDHDATPGDVVPALARLLIDICRKRRAAPQTTRPRNPEQTTGSAETKKGRAGRRGQI